MIVRWTAAVTDPPRACTMAWQSANAVIDELIVLALTEELRGRQ